MMKPGDKVTVLGSDTIFVIEAIIESFVRIKNPDSQDLVYTVIPKSMLKEVDK